MLFAKLAGPLAVAVLWGSVAGAQSAPTFEVATLKPSGADSSRGVSITSTQWVWVKARLFSETRRVLSDANPSPEELRWAESYGRRTESA